MRPLYCFKRENGYYYIQFVNSQTGKRGTAISTHKKDRDAALFVAYKWQEHGIPQKKHHQPKAAGQRLAVSHAIQSLQHSELTTTELLKIQTLLEANGIQINHNPPRKENTGQHPFIQFLLDFWDYDNSKYIQSLLAHGTSITQRHCYEMVNRVKTYWEPCFGNRITIEELQDEDIEDFLLKARAGRKIKSSSIEGNTTRIAKPLTGATINKIINAARKPLKWAMKKRIITYNPTASLDVFNATGKERGILDDSEVQALIALKWKDQRARVATLTAMTTGLRAGELLGLRVQDIRESSLLIEHSWNTKDGLKSTKNGRSREVLLLPYIRTILLEQAKTSPHGFSPSSFVFYSPVFPDKPCDTKQFNIGFYEALSDIKISEEQRKARNIVFHSWRHYNATVIADHLDERTAQLLLGHLTAGMTKRYANHATKKKLEVAAGALDDTFGTAFKFGTGS